MQVVKAVWNKNFLDGPERIQAFEPPRLDRRRRDNQERFGAQAEYGRSNRKTGAARQAQTTLQRPEIRSNLRGRRREAAHQPGLHKLYQSIQDRTPCLHDDPSSKPPNDQDHRAGGSTRVIVEKRNSVN
jgi:hypothetical protein